MKKRERQFTKTAQVILWIFGFVDVLGTLPSKTDYVKKFRKENNYRSYYNALLRLERSGLVKIFREQERKFIKLTEKGKLEVLFIKARLPVKGKWDGRWRMLVFDIPEDTRQERNKLRKLLKMNGYKQIQKSVFLNPYPLNREAIEYLYETGLDKYIRMFRIDEADKGKELKKLFGL